MPEPGGRGGGGGSEIVTEARPGDRALEPRGEGRFAPGTVVAGRYRIVALLGAGGMGEVYRADDTRLGQRVALKFLPAGLAADPAALARLHAEIRIGRQVAHPNVCRLYDVAEADGTRFITMEYVDGEDLASLLRRIGHLPADKALAVAKGICAGPAAAHDRGVLHRDVKPANVMIDGHGQPRVTDFGLAVLSADAARPPGFAGTPAYMAPEQLAGEPATARGDVYALGLVLYEMFTGRRLFDGRSVDEIRAQHAAAKRRPSSLVERMDPDVERVILRCLEESPAARPPSLHAVLAALPGADPLQAAVDAGETPSPEMVAAAARSGDVSVAAGWLLFGAFVLAVAAATLARQMAVVEGYAPRPKPPEVLADRAREVLRALTGAPEPADRAYGYVENRDWLRELARRSTALPVAELRQVPPAAIRFQYRESPELLVPPVYPLQPDPVHEPPRTVPGTASVLLDAYGRLVALDRVPPPASDLPTAGYDWAAVFREAGLTLEDFRASAPRLTPEVGFDDGARGRGSTRGRARRSVSRRPATAASPCSSGSWSRGTRSREAATPCTPRSARGSSSS